MNQETRNEWMRSSLIAYMELQNAAAAGCKVDKSAYFGVRGLAELALKKVSDDELLMWVVINELSEKKICYYTRPFHKHIAEANAERLNEKESTTGFKAVTLRKAIQMGIDMSDMRIE